MCFVFISFFLGSTPKKKTIELLIFSTISVFLFLLLLFFYSNQLFGYRLMVFLRPNLSLLFVHFKIIIFIRPNDFNVQFLGGGNRGQFGSKTNTIISESRIQSLVMWQSSAKRADESIEK